MADELFNQLATQHQSGATVPAPANTDNNDLFYSLANAHQENPNIKTDSKTPWADLVHGLHVPTSVEDAAQEINAPGVLAGKQLAAGAGDFLSDIPKMVTSSVHGAMPGQVLSMPGGQMTEDAIRGGIKAIDYARKGQYTKAAQNTPMVGPIFDYASNHPVLQTAGYLGTGALLTKGMEEGLGAAGDAIGGGGKMPPGVGTPKSAPSVHRETAPVKEMLEIFKPESGLKAIDDYNVVVPRLLREHPDLASGNATLPQVKEALDQTMHENRNFAEAHIGPAKSSRMQIDLNPVADAINKNISSVMERNAPEQADAMREIANRYRGKTDVADVESMMHELNAKVADMRRMNPGEWSQTTQASASKAFLDATTKAMRKQYNDGLENFTGSPAVAQLNREYGTMMGFRQDLEGLIQNELTSPQPPVPGMATRGAEAIQAGKAALNFKAGDALSHLKEAFWPDAKGNIARLAQALKEFKGPPALDYPTPPVYAGPGGTPGSPGNIPPGAYPGGHPAPAGAFPGSNPGPTAGYSASPAGPLPQRKLLGGATPGQKAPLITPPPADTSGPIPNAGPRPGMGMGQQVGERTLPAPAQPLRPHEGEHYGGNGMAPVNKADVIHPSVTRHNVGMVAIQGEGGQRIWVPEGTQGNYIWQRDPNGQMELIDKSSLTSGKLSPASELPKRKR